MFLCEWIGLLSDYHNIDCVETVSSNTVFQCLRQVSGEFNSPRAHHRVRCKSYWISKRFGALKVGSKRWRNQSSMAVFLCFIYKLGTEMAHQCLLDLNSISVWLCMCLPPSQVCSGHHLACQKRTGAASFHICYKPVTTFCIHMLSWNSLLAGDGAVRTLR